MDGLNKDQINIFKECFSKLSIRELNDRIEKFRNLVEIRSISEQRLKEELRKIFTVNLNQNGVFFFLNNDIQTDEHQILNYYRIRKFEPEDYNGTQKYKFPSMQKRQDAWTRPSCDVTKYGRLNRPGESVLYVSTETTNAIYETGCQVGDHFFLLIYKGKRSMRVSQVHNIQYMEELTEEENAKRIIMHNFLLSEFAKFVPTNREYIYKSSLLIYEEFFSSTENDGFSYPSISSPCNRGFNMCFTKDKADRNLNLLGVMVCKLLPSDDNSEFNIEPLLDGFLNEVDGFTFYPYNSEIAREKFGRFAFRREMGL